MPSSTVMKLSARQQALLLAPWRRARYGHRLAWPILRLLHHGKSPSEIAEFLFGSRTSVYRTRTAWQAGEITRGSASGLPRRWWGSLLSAPAGQRLQALRAQAPGALGWARARCSCACLAIELERELGWRVAAETVRRWRHQSPYVWKRAGLVARNDDPEREMRLARIRLCWQQ